MIDRVVQRPFLLWQAEAAAASDASNEPMTVDGNTPSSDEVARAQQALGEAVGRERAQPLTAGRADDDRRGGETTYLERSAYFPRDPALAIAQSVIERYVEEQAPERLRPIEVAGDRRDAETGSAVADMRLEISDDEIPAEESSDRRLGTAFEVTDPRWVSSLFAMGWRGFKHKHAFTNKPAQPRALARDARVIVLGDWASGLRRAQNVATEARKLIEPSQAGDRECHVIHLGDTYYAGWGFEYRRHFLPYWPVYPGELHGSYSLNGNHDMQTGGHGYFDLLLTEPRFAPFHQGSSWFSLENESWQLLALDTAWDDHDLHGDQPGWVQRQLDGHPTKKTMLLSHHQLFSAYGGGGPKLKAKLSGALESDRIDAWLWGHEHRCVVYEEAEKVRAPRCIGHGGVPVYADHSQPQEVRWRLDKSFRMGLEEWALMGFAVLDFDGPQIHVRYIDEFGAEDYAETIS